MLKKICVAFISVQLTYFAIAALAKIITHGRITGPVASAQTWNDGSETTEVSPSPEKKKHHKPPPPPPPNIAGTWTGTIDDHDLGEGDFSITFDETGTGDLSGPWSSDFGSGDFTGNITGTGVLDLNLVAGARCHLKVVGMLVTDDELKGAYKVENCGSKVKGDFGSFDITD